jgi:hypothetical protein
MGFPIMALHAPRRPVATAFAAAARAVVRGRIIAGYLKLAPSCEAADWISTSPTWLMARP